MANVIDKVSPVALVSSNGVVIGIRSETTKLVRLGISDKYRTSSPARCQSSSCKQKVGAERSKAKLSSSQAAIPFHFGPLSVKKWSAAGDRTAPEELAIVPAWFMLVFASVVKWLFWAFTLRLKKPKGLRQHTRVIHARIRSRKRERGFGTSL